MHLTPGFRLGSYEILAPLGAGGMGEVYRAKDTKLDREVAIKVLPAAVEHDRERLARFDREARVLASLNHPNIAQIYGLEEAGDSHSLVMELVAGSTLSVPQPIETALCYAKQIAEALEAAHEKDIIHRDLKPANIMITPTGIVKVLDFGLASVLSRQAGNDPTNSSTMTMGATQAGMILGTASYMSPEQARGLSVDRRADIWAFGVVLYEMLTGRRIFHGETVAETLAAVLGAKIDWSLLPAGTPPAVRRLLSRCLERNPMRRLRDVGDARLELELADEPVVVEHKSSLAKRWLPWIAATAIVGTVLALALSDKSAAPQGPVQHWTLGHQDQLQVINLLALSRDGTRVGFNATVGGKTRIFLRVLDQHEVKPIPDSDDTDYFDFSPDGQWIAYLSGSKVKKTPVTGGASVTLCDGASFNGITWTDRESIIFSNGKSLMQVPASGGAPQTITTPDNQKGETSHLDPRYIPGAGAVLFTISAPASGESANLAVLDLKTGAYHVVVNGGSDPRYVPTGHLVYLRGSTLFAVPFNVRTLAVAGAERPVIEGVAPLSGSYAFSDGGLLAYLLGDAQYDKSQLMWVDRNGVQQASTGPPRLWGNGQISPDGSRLAASIVRETRAGTDIWVYDLQRGMLTRLTFEGDNDNPVWTPDGRRVAFRSLMRGTQGLYQIPADASGKPELLLAAKTNSTISPTSWAPDGKALVYVEADADAKTRLWVLPLAGRNGQNQPYPFHDASANEGAGEVSPDGRWLAYRSEETGSAEIYVQAFPVSGRKIRISSQGGIRPRWSANGRELFYWQLDAESQLMAVEFGAPPTFQIGNPKSLFKLARRPGTTFDVAHDGMRFLIEGGLDQSASKIAVVVNWFTELRRLVPANPR